MSLWFFPLTCPEDCILEYILPTKPKRAKNPPLWGEGEKPTQD
ncbi:hypothetical protein amyaer_3475 [Microcystis aeruginosa NIES-2481]|nr:hypothetical protein amyaer_3475 [Microcystis aeruginosa NIES-2481]